jgi:hypothetical protein
MKQKKIVIFLFGTGETESKILNENTHLKEY